jgi:hypothetical protein
MMRTISYILVFTLTAFQYCYAGNAPKESITIVVPAREPRIEFGAQRLSAALTLAGYQVTIAYGNKLPAGKKVIAVGKAADPFMQRLAGDNHTSMKGALKESFFIRIQKNTSIVAGADASGTLYGCLELAGRIKENRVLPQQLSFSDKPEMVLRGTCIGLQKPYYLPGRRVYEYPYTPETFPWLYDKKQWIQYLDSMVDNRFNSLYLWNGHPFASLVRLKDYPYAVEVDDATFKKNEEIYRFVTEEADKRGIWVIQMFYNIIVSKPFAEKHNIKTQDRERPIMPLIADYTRKSIAAFVEKYPNVGLMVCLGEAMEGAGNDDIEWFTKTIIPGVQDGLKALGKTEEPPIVLRAHDTDAPSVMKAALPLYKNLYTEAKFNGEALTTYEPRGAWAQLHRTLSHLGSIQIENVHIMANLEPFRYAAAGFIQKSVQGMHNIMEANGLHLYPQASYWDWPYTADNSNPRLLQVERDWLWYKQWSRYAWNCHRDSTAEIAYWSGLLASKFGCSQENGKQILDAFEESGRIAPKILRRYGITDGNRQTMTLGMLMTQLINPRRYGLFTLMYESESPEGEMIIDYAEREWKKQKHVGETPVQIANEVVEHGKEAMTAIQKAAPFITKNKDEFKRITDDMRCYNLLANHYAEKARAALNILRYKYSNDIGDLDKALPLLQKSVDWYRQLADLTKATYLYANSMQTQQRRIPIRGVDGTFKTWVEVLKPFELELHTFEKKIDSLKQAKGGEVKQRPLVKNAAVELITKAAGSYRLDEGAKVFTDTAATISKLAPELKELSGLSFSKEQQQLQGTAINFSCTTPVNVLVGFFNAKLPAYLKEPELETNAQANDYGQAEIKIANAIIIDGLPPVNIHSYSFPAGTHQLVLGKGACLVLGFTTQSIKPYDAGLNDPFTKNIDWLFE